MKKIILLTIFMTTLKAGISQFGFYSIGVESFQGMSFNQVAEDEISQSFHSNEEPKYSYSLAITGEIYKTERISFAPSIGFSNMGMRTKKSSMSFGDQIDPQTGFTTTTIEAGQPASSRFIYNFYSANLTLNTNFYITTGKTKLFAQLSPQFNYITHYKHVLKIWDINNKLLRKDSDDRTKSDQIANTGFTLAGGIGIEMPLAKNLNLQGLTFYKQMLTTIAPQSVTQDKLYGFGLKVGVFYDL